MSALHGPGRGEDEIEAIRDEVISAVAHKLRTPLAIITGYAELLIARDDEETRRIAPLRIKEAADHLLAVVDASLASLDGEGGGAQGTEDPRRVMIVDDDDAVRSLLRLTLPAESFEIVEAADGEEALRVAGEIEADLVLLDWKMPGRSGAEVLTALRSGPRRVPVIVLTADGQQAQKLARSLGADAFLTKPFSPLQLLDTVERLLS